MYLVLLVTAISLLFFSFSPGRQGATPVEVLENNPPTSENGSLENVFRSAKEARERKVELAKKTEGIVGSVYRVRYPLSTAAEKFVTNEGYGSGRLYGTRNMRAVLNGVYYRGGANNFYHHSKRPNKNPLPVEGLVNLCEEGFGKVVYLYDENYETAPHLVKCRDFRGAENTLDYLQISTFPLGENEKELREMHAMISDHVRDPRLGPIYDHCWNGWHASGYVAATALMQFCGFSAEEAVAYWDLNTDGDNKEPGYEKIRVRIRAFAIDPKLGLSAEEKSVLCPVPGSLVFRGMEAN